MRAKLIIGSFLVVFMLSMLYLDTPNISAESWNSENTISPYPSPIVPSHQTSVPESTYKIYLPITKKSWSYLSGIVVPPYSMSKYVTDFGNNYDELYKVGCELGHRAEALSGTQDFLIYLGFGQAYQFSDGEYGADLIHTRIKKRLSEIKEAVTRYANGFYLCSGNDRYSHLTIGIGISNDSPYYTESNHGSAWAEMVTQASNMIYAYSSQVSVVGGANIELGMNGPSESRQWVDGYKNYIVTHGYVQFPLFVIGDAAGCRTINNNTNCGSENYPDWETNDVWYVNFGSGISYPIPEIYTHDWVQAEQWYMLSLYSAGYTPEGPMLISGSFTQYLACQQEINDPDCPLLDNAPDDAYKMLYTILYSDPITRDVIDALIYPSDISYAPTPTPIP